MEEPRCPRCDTLNIKTLSIDDQKIGNPLIPDIPIENLRCLECGIEWKVPIASRQKWLKESLKSLNSSQNFPE